MASLGSIQKRIWEGQIPLQIVLSPVESRIYDQCDPYIISVPRLSYLPFLLPRLLAFFSLSLIEPGAVANDGWFSFEGVPLKWHHPVGLLYDLYVGSEQLTFSHGTENQVQASADESDPSGSDDGTGDEKQQLNLPWRLMVHFRDWPDQELVPLDAGGMVLHDAFMNSVKEADFLRNGTAKRIMSLSKEDSWGLWKSVQEHNLSNYYRINNTLLLPSMSTPLRNIPIRIYLPTPPESTSPSLKVIQTPIPPLIPPNPSPSSSVLSSTLRSSRPQPQTIGTALHTLLPSLFPSRRTPMLARPILHGAMVPMTTPVDELVRCATYADGWLAIVISMI